MKAPPQKPGDVFLLFHILPYNFEKELPLAVGPNVYLDNTPQNVLSEAHRPLEDDSVDLAFYLPAYGVFMNRCLRCPTGKVQLPGITPTDHFFLSVTALRLCKPLAIRIAVQFELGQEEDLIKNPFLFLLTSLWQPDNNAEYSAEDIRFSAEVAKRLLDVWNSCGNRYKRIVSASVLFSQVTCGQSKSFQMVYMALFSALESLFVPKENKAEALARRVAKFLSSYDCEGFKVSKGLEGWLRHEYEKGRNNLFHGVQDVSPWTKGLRKPKKEVLGRLHEITRLCILGFLSFDDDKLAVHSNSNGKKLQKWLDDLAPATGRFLEDQRMWCS